MPRPLPAVAAMMPATCVPCPTKSLSDPRRKFLVLGDRLLQVGVAGVDAAVDDRDRDIRRVLESPRRPRVTEANRSVSPLPRGERIDAGFLPPGEQLPHRRHEGVLDFLHARHVRRQLRGARAFADLQLHEARRPASGAAVAAADSGEHGGCAVDVARVLVEHVLDACDAAVVDEASQTRLVRHPGPVGGASPRRHHRSRHRRSRRRVGGHFGDDRSLRLLRRLDLVFPQMVPVPVLRHHASQFVDATTPASGTPSSAFGGTASQIC